MAAFPNSTWRANCPSFDSSPRASSATFAVGHLSTGDTPSQSLSLSTSANEKARVDGRQISSEWHDNIVLIKPETFLPIFMYGQPDPTTTDEGTVTSLSSSQRGARDEQLAKECLEALKSQDKSRKFNQVVQSLATHGLLRQMGDISPGISPYAADRFTKIVTNINSERDSYGRLTSSTPDAGGKRITEAHPYSTVRVL